MGFTAVDGALLDPGRHRLRNPVHLADAALPGDRDYVQTGLPGWRLQDASLH